MKKADHLKFLELFDIAALAFGARKFIYREIHHDSTAPQLDGYEFQTVYGPLVLHPDKPWKIYPGDKRRTKYTVDVFGKFTGIGPYPPDANKFSGKWNWHFGSAEPRYCVNAIFNKVESILSEKY